MCGAHATVRGLLKELTTPARTVVMDRGRIIFDGTSTELSSDPERLSALIGVAG